jgi:G6PDH family F420-dependent oxidoreductase
VNVRHEMLGEAVEIIGELFAGGYVNRAGPHYRVDSAKLWDCPEGGVPIAVAVSGEQSIESFAPVADAMVAVEPLPELVHGFDAAAGTSLPKIGQQPIIWDPDRETAVRRAHEEFRWFAGGWKVNAELPGTAAFAAATRYVRPDDVAGAIPCGPDPAAHVEAVRPFVDAGFTHVALVQVGGDIQPDFLTVAERELLPALREEFGKADAPAIRVR